MVDMQQSDSAKISNKVLADRMKQLKQGKEFVTMCKEIERFENEVTVKVASEERINAVKLCSAVDWMIKPLQQKWRYNTISLRKKSERISLKHAVTNL